MLGLGRLLLIDQAPESFEGFLCHQPGEKTGEEL